MSLVCGLAVHSLMSTHMGEARKRDPTACYHIGFLVLSSAAITVAGKDVLQEDVTGARGMLETLGSIKPSGQSPAPASLP